MQISTHYHTESHMPLQNAFTAAWVAQKIWGTDETFCKHASMSVWRGGHLIGGVIFHEFQPDCGTIEMSCAGDAGWLTRRVVNDAMRFCFDMLGVQMVLGRARADNAAALKMDRILYADEYVIPRMFGRDCAGHVFTLTDEQWLTHRLNAGKNSVTQR